MAEGSERVPPGSSVARQSSERAIGQGHHWRHTRSRVWSERCARITRARLQQDILPGPGSVPIGDIDPVMLLDGLIDDHCISDATWRELATQFSPPQLMGLVFGVGGNTPWFP